MPTDLVKRWLNAHSADERKAINYEISGACTNEDVAELIRIANGGELTVVRGSEREHWFSLTKREWVDYRWQFGSETQLDAFEALGWTKNRRVLGYLTEAAAFKLPEGYGGEHCLGGPTGNGLCRPSFWDVHGPLGEKLKDLPDILHGRSYVNRHGLEAWLREYADCMDRNPEHKTGYGTFFRVYWVLRSAIGRLQNDLQQNTI